MISCFSSFKISVKNANDNLPLSCPSFKSKPTPVDRSLTCEALELWNALPLEVRSAKSVDVLQAKLRTHLFSLAFLSQLTIFKDL